jgi:hypothetical protein
VGATHILLILSPAILDIITNRQTTTRTYTIIGRWIFSIHHYNIQLQLKDRKFWLNYCEDSNKWYNHMSLGCSLSDCQSCNFMMCNCSEIANVFHLENNNLKWQNFPLAFLIWTHTYLHVWNLSTLHACVHI